MAEKSIDDRALDVATQVLHHIDTMYPGMWKGVPASARTSLWNTIISAVNVRFRPAVETTSAPSAPAAVGADRKCNICDGTGLKHRGLKHRNVDTECWACGGTGRVAMKTSTVHFPSNETLRRQIESDPDDDPSAGGGPP